MDDEDGDRMEELDDAGSLEDDELVVDCPEMELDLTMYTVVVSRCCGGPVTLILAISAAAVVAKNCVVANDVVYG